MARIRLEAVRKVFPNGHVAAHSVDLDIGEGELMVLVGPSGCGKSTLLRMIAGLETPTSGRIFIGDRDVTAVPPQERDIAMVFQTYALYPHKTVRENLEFSLRMRGLKGAAISERVQRAAAVLGLEDLLGRKPRQLSGGQRQRVALGRAIVREPSAFLLDEPLSNLDAKLRVQTRAELARLHRRLRATMVYVTHDQEEAMTLGDRIAVLRDGVLQQAAPPLEVYRKPVNAFVAGFIGSPAMNFLRVRSTRTGSRSRLESAGVALDLDSAVPAEGEFWLGIRPQDIEIVPEASGDANGRVDVIEPLGSQLVVHVDFPGVRDGAALLVVAPPDAPVTVDEQAGLRFRRDRLHLFDVASERSV